ncbi:MAG: TerB family tellurite resistance protein [Candidatus Eremiobacteraeota bacterium]|nr:TerB family tellurite resistance protein [Candidatus Eremiobacteraeota bacterium]
MDEQDRLILRSLVQMMWADGEVDERERDLLGRMLVSLGVSDGDLKDVAAMMTHPETLDVEALRGHIPELADRLAVVKAMLVMAMADGVLELSETRLMGRLSDVLELSEQQMEEACSDVLAQPEA